MPSLGFHVDSSALVELFGLGRADESKSVAVRFERRAHEVKVACAHFPLVLDRGVAAFGGSELGLLQVDVRGHPIARIAISTGRTSTRLSAWKPASVMNWNA